MIYDTTYLPRLPEQNVDQMLERFVGVIQRPLPVFRRDSSIIGLNLSRKP
jgi:hypothetical protein